MTISATTNRVSTNGNGVTTAFPVSFPFHAQADLVVISTVITTGVQTTKALTTDYTISGTTDDLGHYPNGGTVNFLVAPANTVRITIYRDPARTQSTDLTENDNLPAESVEATFDYVTMLIQRLNDRLDRALRQPEGDSANIDLLPSKVDRASKYLTFDADGDPVASSGSALSALIVSAFMETVLDDSNAAAARTTLGAVGLTGDETVAGVKTFSSAIPSPTLTTPTINSPTIATPTVTGLIDASHATAGQVKFPASQNASADANTLDDYEEGTWTPAVGGSATYTGQTGYYTKIGRQVTVTCDLAINAIGTGSTSVISGLPFTALRFATGAVYWGAGAVTPVTLVAAVGTGGTTVTLYGITAAGASLAALGVMGNGTSIAFTLTYFV